MGGQKVTSQTKPGTPTELPWEGHGAALGVTTCLCPSAADGTVPLHSFILPRDAELGQQLAEPCQGFCPRGRWWPLSRQQTKQNQGGTVVELGNAITERCWGQHILGDDSACFPQSLWRIPNTSLYLDFCQKPGNVLLIYVGYSLSLHFIMSVVAPWH